MNKKHSMVVIIVVLAILLLPKLILPKIVEYKIAQALILEVGGSVEVDVRSRFGWELLEGHFSHIVVKGENWAVGELPLAAFYFEGHDFRLDSDRLINAGEFHYISAGNLQASATLEQAGLNEYYWALVDPNKFFKIDVTDAGIRLAGQLNFWDTVWNLSLAGDFEIREQSQVVFVPEELAVQDTKIPRLLLDLISENYTLILDFSQLPIPFMIDEIDLSAREITVYGSGVAND